MYYYSKINDKKIIFSLFKFNDFKKNRIDFTPDTEYLQASCSLLNKNKRKALLIIKLNAVTLVFLKV